MLFISSGGLLYESFFPHTSPSPEQISSNPMSKNNCANMHPRQFYSYTYSSFSCLISDFGNDNKFPHFDICYEGNFSISRSENALNVNNFSTF